MPLFPFWLLALLSLTLYTPIVSMIRMSKVVGLNVGWATDLVRLIPYTGFRLALSWFGWLAGLAMDEVLNHGRD